MSRTIGYIRVSTAEQDVEKNKNDVLRLANNLKLGTVEWVEEKVSGTKNWRERELGKVLSELEAGDTVIVPELSRLGRSTLQILEIMQLAKEKNIAVHAPPRPIAWTLIGIDPFLPMKNEPESARQEVF